MIGLGLASAFALFMAMEMALGLSPRRRPARTPLTRSQRDVRRCFGVEV